MNIEECLREIEDRAALLRYLASSVTSNSQPPDPAALSGIADACARLRR